MKLPFLFASLLVLSLWSRAEDWPTYRHDIARSGITPEKLTTPLHEAWVFRSQHLPSPAWEPPRAVPVEGYLELPRIRFDDAYHVVVAGGLAFFGSSSDHKVYCLDAFTGKVRWTFFTGGPVRLAPTVAEGRVYFGSDDGRVYCLAAADGSVFWQRRVGPTDERLLGHGKMISRWPIRTGVLVDQGTAYFGAGLFPSEGVYLEAVRADTGQLVWRNDTGGESVGSRVSPQGYLLASSDRLIVPQGRATPALFDRRDGKAITQPLLGKSIGGTDALLAGEELYTGTEEIMGYDAATRAKVAWFAARKVIITPDTAYVVSTNAMLALDRSAYPALARAWLRLRDEESKLTRAVATSATERKRLAAAIAQDRAALAALTDPEARAKAEKELQSAETKLATVEQQLDATRQRLAQLHKKLQEARAEMSQCIRWQLQCECPDSLILAGDVLFAGGQDHVIAVAAATGAKLWEATVFGKAKGLAVANGHLYASTDNGMIYCFSSTPVTSRGRVTESPGIPGYPRDKYTALYMAAADAIVRESGVRRGYCLVLGCETGRLALELARRTELQIIGVEPDAEKVVAARRALDAAGVYGVRIVVDHGPLDRLPYAPFFANLVVSDTGLFKELPDLRGEVERVLKPIGGVAMIGPLAHLKQCKVVRGPLPGAGSWTHLYGNAANTAGGDEKFLKCPLGLLWFGDPGPLEMPSRHRRAAGPLAVGGVLVVPAEHAVHAYDAYNGVKLWSHTASNVLRTVISQDSSNFAADTNHVYVAHTNTCLRLDLQTGALKTIYALPQPPEPANCSSQRWGHLAVAEGRLVGSVADGTNRTSHLLFAYDTGNDQLVWTHRATRILHTSISVGEGRVFFVERPAASTKRSKTTDNIYPVTALSLADGRVLWKQSLDLTGCVDGKYWGALGSMVHDGVLVLFGVYTDGHYWKEFFADQFQSRRVLALNAKDGSTLWSKNIAYRVRPLILGDTLHAEPWAFDLHTGAQRQRTNPITGHVEPWQFARPGHHCGAPVAAPNVMFFRSYYLGYYDLVGDYGTMTFGGQRPGCWINFIPANGLALMPEASSGCMCPFPIMCTVVLAPRTENRAWAQYSINGDIKPVQHLALHLGAPGDRRDESGTLWLAYPRPKGSLVLDFKLDLQLTKDGGYFAHSADFLKIDGTASPWLYTFGASGLQRCEIPLLEPGSDRARYTVRLGFAEIEDRKPGERIFDIALQGQPVQKNFDIARLAGGARKALIKEFNGVEVTDNLVIELTPAPSSHPPILQTIEIIKERTRK